MCSAAGTSTARRRRCRPPQGSAIAASAAPGAASATRCEMSMSSGEAVVMDSLPLERRPNGCVKLERCRVAISLSVQNRTRASAFVNRSDRTVSLRSNPFAPAPDPCPLRLATLLTAAAVLLGGCAQGDMARPRRPEHADAACCRSTSSADAPAPAAADPGRAGQGRGLERDQPSAESDTNRGSPSNAPAATKVADWGTGGLTGRAAWSRRRRWGRPWLQRRRQAPCSGARPSSSAPGHQAARRL